MTQKTQIQSNNSDLALTDQDVLTLAQLKGRKLGVLLAKSSMPEDVKKGWVALLPMMNLSQMERLLDILEAEYLNEATAEIDNYYAKRIKKYSEKYDKEDDALVEKLDKMAQSHELISKHLGKDE